MRQIQIPASIRPDGVAYAEIIFTLVDGAGLPLVGVQATTGGPISEKETVVVVDFQRVVDLTPNDEIYVEASLTSWYSIAVTIGNAQIEYRRQIATSGTPLTWAELIGGSDPVTPPALETWVTHPADDDRHLMPDERAALTAANAPAAGNPVATIADVTGAGGGDMHTLIYDPRGIADDTFDLAHLTGNLDGGVF